MSEAKIFDKPIPVKVTKEQLALFYAVLQPLAAYTIKSEIEAIESATRAIERALNITIIQI